MVSKQGSISGAFGILSALLLFAVWFPCACLAADAAEIGAVTKVPDRPNILIAISDDHSSQHISMAGSRFVETPNIDSLASDGLYFTNAYAASPGCSPSRAALLTGRHHWMIGPAGTHGSSFPAHYPTIVDILETAGYKTGFTGKGWGPGDWIAGGRKSNPTGTEYNSLTLESQPIQGISEIDYASNFQLFLEELGPDEPFIFWYGAHEPHLPYAEVAQSESDLVKVEVPNFLPDTVASRSMLLDYANEIGHFDAHLGKILSHLDTEGRLENTIIIVTADNGMPMPRAKANGYDYGIHVPLVIRWGRYANEAKVIHAPVGFVDLTATILDSAGLDVSNEFVGQSLLAQVKGDVTALDYERAVYSGRERHSSSRYNNFSYPQRMIRRGDFLAIWNLAPERDPAGQSREVIGTDLGPSHGAYFDIDDSMIKRELIASREDPYINSFLRLAVEKRPEWQLFNVSNDPECLINLTDDVNHKKVLSDLQNQLKETLVVTGDPRALGYGQVWEEYPRLRGPMRHFPRDDHE